MKNMFEKGLLVSVVSPEKFRIMLKERNSGKGDQCQNPVLSAIETKAEADPVITLGLKVDTRVTGVFQGIAADIDEEGELLGYDVVGLKMKNDVVLIPEYLISGIVDRASIAKRSGRKYVAAAVILLMFAAVLTGHLYVHSPRQNVKIMGRKAYYLEEVSGMDFMTRSYYDRETDELLAKSFGYRIMDDSVDLDGNGIDELLCTCECDGKVELLIYKDTDDGIIQGRFTPEGLHLDDMKGNGSCDFICYYLPASGEIQGEYWTDEYLKILTLSHDQAIYEPFPQGQGSFPF